MRNIKFSKAKEHQKSSLENNIFWRTFAVAVIVESLFNSGQTSAMFRILQKEKLQRSLGNATVSKDKSHRVEEASANVKERKAKGGKTKLPLSSDWLSTCQRTMVHHKCESLIGQFNFQLYLNCQCYLS